MSHTEPAARHFFTLWELASQHIYDETCGYGFVGTGESGYLRRNLRLLFYKFFSLQSFDNKHALFNSGNKIRPRDGARLSAPMPHSAIGSYSSNL
jgi:hypothetical protein